MKQSVAVRDSNNNKHKCTSVPIDFHVIKALKDDTLIGDECFFNMEEMYSYWQRQWNNGSIPKSPTNGQHAQSYKYAEYM